MQRFSFLCLRLLTASLLMTVWSCSPAAERPGSLSDIGDQSPGYSLGDTPGAYPEGPYAPVDPEVGAVLRNVKLLGYVNHQGEKVSTKSEYREIDLQEFREGEARYLLIHISGYWCSSCHLAAYHLSEQFQEIVGRSGTALEILVDGSAQGSDPRLEELDSWIETAGLTLTTVTGADDNLRSSFKERGHAYIVDLETMEVVWRIKGIQLDPTITELALDELFGQWLPVPASQ